MSPWDKASRPYRWDNDKSRAEGSARIPGNEEYDDDEIGIGRDTCLRTSRDTAPPSVKDDRGASKLEETEREGEDWSDGGRQSNRKSSGNVGEHVCRVCGMPIPSFGKLVDCRLSLDQAREELCEARARIAELAEGTGMHAEIGATAEARGWETAPMVKLAAARDGEASIIPVERGAGELLGCEVGHRFRWLEAFR